MTRNTAADRAVVNRRAAARLASAPWTRRAIAIEAAWRFGLNVAFPHLCHLARWPTRLGPRGTAVYVAAHVLGGAAVRGAAVHAMLRYADGVDELREQLGREPTEVEIAERFGWDPPACPR